MPNADTPPTRHIVLIRTGRTPWDDAGRFQGAAELPPSEDALAALAAELTAWAETQSDLPDLVFAASHDAATDSARLAADLFTAKLKPAEGLLPMNLGLWEGLTAEDLEERHPRNYKQWRESPASVSIPEGDAVKQFQERALAAILRSLEKHPKKRLAFVARPLEFAILSAMLEHRTLDPSINDDLLAGVSIVIHHADTDWIRNALDTLPARV